MDIERAIKTVEQGKLAILPTDTVYGIIGDATNPKAIELAYLAKKRDIKKPFLILVSSYEMIKEYVSEISTKEQLLIDKFLPGELTILFKKNNKLPNNINNNGLYIGIRYPNNKELIQLINKLKRPVFSTSLNISGEETVTNLKNINKDLLKYIDYIYDVGEIKGTSSTIVKVENDNIIIIRRGTLADKISALN